MYNKTIFCVVIMSGLLSSCSITKTTPRTLEINQPKVMVKPMIAEVKVDVSKKISGQAISKLNEEAAKEQAKWNAIEKSGADMIVDPVYNIVVSGKSWNVTVTGFHGKYIEIKTASAEEIEQLEYLLPSEMKAEKAKTFKALKLIGK